MLEGTFFTLLGVSWVTRLVFRQLARLRRSPASLPCYSSICDFLLCCSFFNFLNNFSVNLDHHIFHHLLQVSSVFLNIAS